MLYISDLTGNQEPLLVSDVHITQQLNTVEQIDFTTINIPDNESAYKMLQPRSIITVPETGEQYRISENDGTTFGNNYQRTITGLQVLQDLDDHLIMDKLTGSQSLDSTMQFLTKGTKFTYTIHDSFDNFDFGEDGIGQEKALGLFTDTVMNDFKFEFKAHGYHIDIYKSLGEHNAFVYVSGSDIYTLADTGDYTQIRTHIYGVGKTTETTTENSSDSFQSSDSDDSSDDTDSTTTSSTVKAEYTSPFAKVYGVIDDDLFTDDNATTEDQLIQEMKAKLKDYPSIQYTANVNKFETNNPTDKLNDPTIGNWGYLKDRNDIDVETRVIQKDLYPQSNQEDTLTFGNFMLDPNKLIVEMQSNRNSDNNVIKELKEKISQGGSGDIEQQFTIKKVGEVND